MLQDQAVPTHAQPRNVGDLMSEKKKVDKGI